MLMAIVFGMARFVPERLNRLRIKPGPANHFQRLQHKVCWGINSQCPRTKLKA